MRRKKSRTQPTCTHNGSRHTTIDPNEIYQDTLEFTVEQEVNKNLRVLVLILGVEAH